MFTVARIETQNYGWVESQHTTYNAAAEALDKKITAFYKKAGRAGQNAAAHLMWRITENVPAKTAKGTRVRL